MAEKILEIEKVISNGCGLGRMSDGKIAMVPYVLPGELVSYRIIRQHKDYAECLPLDIKNASPFRTDPLCSHFGQCGGCDFQHATYDFQLAIKNEFLHDQLSHLLNMHSETHSPQLRVSQAPIPAAGLVSESDVSNLPYGDSPRHAAGSFNSRENEFTVIWQGVAGSPKHFHYRQRVRLHIDERGEVGFFRPGSNILEPVSGCPLASAETGFLIPFLLESVPARRLLDISRELEILSSPGDNTGLIVFHTRRKPRAGDLVAARELLSELIPVKAVVLDTEGALRQTVCADGNDELTAASIILPFSAPGGQNAGGYELTYEAGGFSQVNHELNQVLVNVLIDWVRESGAQRVLDMYCGMGNFSIPLAMLGYKVSGFDQQRSSVRSAEKNSARYGLDCNFFRSSAAGGMKILAERGAKFDLLIIDPPRMGCKESIPAIIAGDCRWIVYVSCDPATLFRDLAMFLEHGFRLQKAAGFDMFPQTRHLETMVMLGR
ncbi:MAG: methyltransferase [Proteobacteria bacterium]|nr:methyltransferase [Pseudomonadota bacterium]